MQCTLLFKPITVFFALQGVSSSKVFKYRVVLLFIALNWAVRLVAHPVFVQFFAICGLRFSLPGLRTFQTCLVELHVHCSALLKALLALTADSYDAFIDGEHVPFLHISTDFWSSKHQVNDQKSQCTVYLFSA